MWRWCRGSQRPGSTRYSGEPGAWTVGNTVLLGLFLASVCSVPVGIMLGALGGHRNLDHGVPGSARYGTGSNCHRTFGTKSFF